MSDERPEPPTEFDKWRSAGTDGLFFHLGSSWKSLADVRAERAEAVGLLRECLPHIGRTPWSPEQDEVDEDLRRRVESMIDRLGGGEVKP